MIFILYKLKYKYIFYINFYCCFGINSLKMNILTHYIIYKNMLNPFYIMDILYII